MTKVEVSNATEFEKTTFGALKEGDCFLDDENDFCIKLEENRSVFHDTSGHTFGTVPCGDEEVVKKINSLIIKYM